MNIGIDAREFKRGVYTGLRTMLDDFLCHSAARKEHDLVLFCNQHTDMEHLPAFAKKVLIPERNTFLWDQYELPRAISREKIHVFYTPYVKTPLWRVCPYVNMICDIIPLKRPRRGGIAGLAEKAHFYVYSFLFGHRAVKTVTLSRDARCKVARRFCMGPEKLKVIYPSVSPNRIGEDIRRTLSEYGIEKPYFLYVGNFKPHKNVGNLIEAFSRLPRDILGRYRLVLVGGKEESLQHVKGKISDLGLDERVTPLPNVDTNTVRSIMQNADIFVFPSLEEGFGIPPVEAMASGVPVASSDLAPMTETLQEAAVYFDPLDPDDISKAMAGLARDESLRSRCIEKGLKRAGEFDPERMSRELLNVLEDAGKPKTLCVSSEFPPVKGGIATHVYNLWSRLPVKRVAILTSRPPGVDYDSQEGMDITRKTYPLGTDIVSRTVRALMVIWHVIRQNSIRNIKRNHCAQVLSAGVGALLVKMVKGTSYVVYMYSADILEFSRTFLTRWIMEKVLRQSEHVIANSIFTRSLLVSHRLVPPDAITVSTPAVDTDMFNPAKGDNGVKEKYGIPQGKKVLLTISRLAERKGHENVIRAFSKIRKDFPDTVYVIVGDGPTRPILEELIQREQLEGHVILTGEIPLDKLVFFDNACDIFIMTPRYIKEKGDVEGFGIVFLEANACGKPVIAGKSGGVVEAVADGETGILVDPEDTEQIKRAIITLLEDEEKARALGERGLRRVKEDFNWSTRVKELEKHV
ncbi:MAG: glycosyltransferase [Candidatus Omnitrophica bacterium]|nr:glycosyltransferase [Candidatus Omnitrophota bacterium]